jgi:molybdopterin-guanine dinucleotide biosynthesis protein A
MGQDKVWLDAGGHPLLVRVAERLASHVAEIIVVHSPMSAPLPSLPVRFVLDHYQGIGPLGGLHAGLAATHTPWTFAVACDMPFLNPILIRYLALLRPGHDVIVPCPTGQPEPLHAFYHQRCLPAIEASLMRATPSLVSFYAAMAVRRVSRSEIAPCDPDLRSFLNLNTPEEWNAARHLAGW